MELIRKKIELQYTGSGWQNIYSIASLHHILSFSITQYWYPIHRETIDSFCCNNYARWIERILVYSLNRLEAFACWLPAAAPFAHEHTRSSSSSRIRRAKISFASHNDQFDCRTITRIISYWTLHGFCYWDEWMVATMLYISIFNSVALSRHICHAFFVVVASIVRFFCCVFVFPCVRSVFSLALIVSLMRINWKCTKTLEPVTQITNCC